MVRAAPSSQGPAAPPHGVRSPTPSADRTTAGPAMARWRPGPGVPRPPTPPTTSSWLRSKERASRLVREWWPVVTGTGWGVLGGLLRVVPMGPGLPTGTGSPRSRGGGAPTLAWPCPCQHLCSSFPGTSDPKEDGLDAQISRLAGLIGRLENKVGPLSPHIHPSIPPPPSQPPREGGTRLELTGGKSGNLNAPGWGWGWCAKGRPWEYDLCTCMGPGEESYESGWAARRGLPRSRAWAARGLSVKESVRPRVAWAGGSPDPA